jgi:membrane-associated protein
MEILAGINIIDMFLHLDTTLEKVIADYQTWVYLLLFAVVFCETGLVVTPFLPGDSLLFAAGAIAAGGALNPWMLLALLAAAAILGDGVNYAIGKFLGPKVLKNENSRIFKKHHLEKTHAFYEKYGGKTIILARFVPIVRTFAPFVAGVGTMSYAKFAVYNIVGGVVWVAGFIVAGYYFGNLPAVKSRFHLVIIAIIVISVIPIALEYWKARRA